MTATEMVTAAMTTMTTTAAAVAVAVVVVATSTTAAPANHWPLPSDALVNCRPPLPLLPLVGCCMVVRCPLSSLIVAPCRAIVDALVAGRFHCHWWYCHQPPPAFTSSDNGWFLRLCSPHALVVACCRAILDSLVAMLSPGALVASRRPPLPFPSMVGCCGHRPSPTFIVACRHVIVDSLVATLPPGALVASRRSPLPFPLMVGCHPLLSSSPRFCRHTPSCNR